jgi:hypothetical protein
VHHRHTHHKKTLLTKKGNGKRKEIGTNISTKKMRLTKGAIEALTQGAWVEDEEVTAVVDGEERWAGQIVWKDDKATRIGMAHTEYRPVLRVVKKEWLGNWGIAPTIKFHVTDDEEEGEEMVMIASHRTFDIAKYFAKKWGDNRLGVGRRFQLVDYTTRVCQAGKLMAEAGPIICAERIRCEPKSQHQTKLLSFLRKNEKKSKNEDQKEEHFVPKSVQRREAILEESSDEEDEETQAILNYGPVFGPK